MWTSPRSNTVCVFCEKGFQNNGQLRRHLLIHTGERPFRCKSCNYSANQAVHLKTHCLRVHSGDPGSYNQSDSDDDTGYDFSFLIETPKEASSDSSIIVEDAKTPKPLGSDTIGPKKLFRNGKSPMQSPVRTSTQTPTEDSKAALKDEGPQDGDITISMINQEESTKEGSVAETSALGNDSNGVVADSDSQPVAEIKPNVGNVSIENETPTAEDLMPNAAEVLNYLTEELLLPPKPQLSSAPSTPVAHSIKRKRIEGDQIVPAKKTRAQSVDNLPQEEPDLENTIHCEECEYTCTYWRSMTTHMKNVHRSNQQDEATIKCLQCDQLFKSSFALKIHENRIHVTDKPYKCKHCNFASVSKQYWLRHERFQHSPPAGAVGVKTRKIAEEEIRTAAEPELVQLQNVEEKIREISEENPLNENIKEEEPHANIIDNPDNLDETVLVIAE